jgi:hypothetical protein
MESNKAVSHFLGKNGLKKLNCGQSIMAVFKETCSIDDKLVSEFGSYGSGRAPEGLCGRGKDEKTEECKESFIKKTGSVKCKEIRALKKASCLACVEEAALFLKKNIGEI